MRAPYPNELHHSGVAGQKWGYSYGRRIAGKRTAAVPSTLISKETAQGVYEYAHRDRSQSPLWHPNLVEPEMTNYKVNGKQEVDILTTVAKWADASIDEFADYIPAFRKIKEWVDKHS